MVCLVMVASRLREKGVWREENVDVKKQKEGVVEEILYLREDGGMEALVVTDMDVMSTGSFGASSRAKADGANSMGLE